jgi:Xaa-Pro aminopeptidase
MGRFEKRRDKLRRMIRKQGLDGLLVTNFTNVTYLSGFTGDDSYLVVGRNEDILVSDQRYTTQLQEECPGLELAIRGPGKKMISSLLAVFRGLKIQAMGIEANSMSVGLRDALDGGLKQGKLVGTQDWVEQLRMIKDQDEIARTRTACLQARRAMEVVRALLTPDMTELDVAAELEYQARRFGAKSLSFPPIIAVGPRSALPHANPTSGRIGSGDFTLFDWGANEGLYLSDLTRILVTGKISPKLRKIYAIVLEAQLTAIRAIRPGIPCEEVDRIARDIIAKAGYGKRFGHGLGHGTGLDIHEAPRFSQGQKTVLKAGMIVTVEPGIYLPGWGGVRIEDDVLVTREGHEVLSSVPNQLEECQIPYWR